MQRRQSGDKSIWNAITAASSTSALAKKKGAPEPPNAKMFPAASGPITRQRSLPRTLPECTEMPFVPR